MEASNWWRASLPDLRTLALILELAYEHEEQTGRKITAAEMTAALLKPGK